MNLVSSNDYSYPQTLPWATAHLQYYLNLSNSQQNFAKFHGMTGCVVFGVGFAKFGKNSVGNLTNLLDSSACF